jgi:geranylgeranyl diphosphate synthase type I
VRSELERFLKKYRSGIEKELSRFLEGKRTGLQQVNSWGDDILSRMKNFSVKGKLLRGSLIVLSYLMFRSGPAEHLSALAAAAEIIHSSLLIHDDIMDRDEMRRGEPSIYHGYSRLARSLELDEAEHFGQSFGICAGDIGFFLAFELLSEAELEPDIRLKILGTWSREFVSVGLAQMQDIYFSVTSDVVDEESVLNLYRFKTARYTFSLPLITGAIVAGKDTPVIEKLSRIGECMGLVFQIKDDELGLFGREEKTGKPVGTDMHEGKKTLHSLYLRELLERGGNGRTPLSKAESETLGKTLLHGCMDSESLQEIVAIADKFGIRERANRKMAELSRNAEGLILELRATEQYQTILLGLLQYNLNRER